VSDSANGSVTGSVKSSERVEAIRAAFRAKRTRPYAWRAAQLKQLKKFLQEKDREICEALWTDLRKGSFEAEVTEQGIVIGEIDYALTHLEEWMRPESVSTPFLDFPGSSEIISEPYGVVLIIGAWNYPVNLLLAPLVGAIAGGNAAVLKPSELAPATSAAMAKWIPEYLDREAIIVVEGGVEDTEELLAVQFDSIFFTGSGKVGKLIMARAAEHLTPVTLELGGKSPAIVMDDASVKVAARRIAWGKFMNAGQTCIAPDYVLVHPGVEKEFIDELKISLESFYGKDPKLSPDYCRIVNDRNFLRLEKFLGDGELVCGGQSDTKERYIAPTVLRGVSASASVMQEEIFGPILPVLSISDVGQAIDFINARPKPLALYLFSKSDAIRARVLEETSSGGVCINDVVMHMPSLSLPFGGVGASGMGHYHGKRSFETFTHQKGVMTKTTWPDIRIRYAPYTESKRKWIQRLM
jgi:aldehyde dehydrogenase (NAD+)